MIYYNLNNGGWKKTTWARQDLGADAFLCCPGPSLADVPRGRGRRVFAINTAYPKVTPDVWMGLDDAACYDKRIWAEPFIKVIKRDQQVDGKMVSSFDNVFLADFQKQEKSMFQLRAHEDKMLWKGNTMASMLHLMVWMGAKRIHLVGCDMGGKKDYYDNRVLTDDQRSYNRRLYKQQVGYIKALHEEGKKYGIEFISCTPDSPLNDFLPHIALEDAIRQSEKKVDVIPEKVKHALDSRKTAVVTPTRGDREVFLGELKKMLAYQTVKPDGVYIIDRKPTKEGNDQRDRVKEGVEKAKKDGALRVIIMEDDDYYPRDYIERVLNSWGDSNLVGGRDYDIYHLRDRQYARYNTQQLTGFYQKRYGKGFHVAPLNATSFTIAAWDKFISSEFYGKYTNLDEELWAWAQSYNVKRKWIDSGVVSIKHGVGKCAGGNHKSINPKYAKPDPELEKLKSLTDTDIFTTYKAIANELADNTNSRR